MKVADKHSSMFQAKLALLLIVSFMGLSGATVLAQTFTFVGIDCPTAITTGPCDVNNLGDVVGGYDTLDCAGCSSVAHAFLWRDGVCSEIVIPDGRNAGALGVNDRGDVVGKYYDLEDRERGFLFRNGTVTTIDVPDANTTATGINNRGTIVGLYELLEDSRNRGFMLSKMGLGNLDYPGAFLTQALGINDYGEIVGVYDDSNGSHGFVFRDGIFTSVDFPGASFTSVEGINNRGQVVGFYFDSSGEHGFLYDGTDYTTIDYPGANTTWVLGVNNAGQIVGFYTDFSSWPHGFLATPIR